MSSDMKVFINGHECVPFDVDGIEGDPQLAQEIEEAEAFQIEVSVAIRNLMKALENIRTSSPATEAARQYLEEVEKELKRLGFKYEYVRPHDPITR